MLNRLFNAKSVAVVGASKSKTKRGYQAIKTLLDGHYEGDIYPVNPNEERILGLLCYPSVAAIEEAIDIVLITTPARTVPGILKECGKKQVAGAVIIAGGFSEMGEEGKRLENEMLAVAKENQIRLVGPNTSGLLNTKNNMNLVGLHEVPKGKIALLTQSGNIALTLITEAKIKSRKGFTYYIGIGNEADIKFHEYLQFLTDDPDTKAILMYVEGMREGRKFLQQCHKTTEKKPIILLKSGRSVTGKKSAGSHTGALAGISEVARTAFQRAGIITIQNSDELFPAAESLSDLPPIKNNKIAILADGGGHATIAADVLTDLGLQIPELGPRTKERLKKILPPAASISNPVDVAGGTDSDPGIFAECAKIILKDHDIGGLLIVGLFGGYGIRFSESLSLIEEDAAHRLGKMVQKYKKPLILHSLYSSVKSHSLDLLRYYGIPVNDSLDVSCKCIGVLAEYGQFLTRYHAKTNFILRTGYKAKSEVQTIIAKARGEGRRALLEYEAKQLIQLHGASIFDDCLAKTEEEAVRIAEEIPGEKVMKIVSPDILHKSDAGGVKLKLRTEADVRQAFKDIMIGARNYNRLAEIRGVIISPMAEDGVEVIIGTKYDDQFGPVIMYGLGGILVEIVKDVSFRVLPISSNSAKKMIEETKSFPILEGIRGKIRYDIKAVQRLLLICSEIIEAYPDIQEMDLNPVIVYQKDAIVVDARIILKEGE